MTTGPGRSQSPVSSTKRRNRITEGPPDDPEAPLRISGEKGERRTAGTVRRSPAAVQRGGAFLSQAGKLRRMRAAEALSKACATSAEAFDNPRIFRAPMAANRAGDKRRGRRTPSFPSYAPEGKASLPQRRGETGSGPQCLFFQPLTGKGRGFSMFEAENIFEACPDHKTCRRLYCLRKSAAL